MSSEATINGLTLDAFLKKATASRTVSFWGTDYTVTPALVDEVHGDGLQVVWLSSINTRPNYYLLRIDSSIQLSNDESLSEKDQYSYGTVMELLLHMVSEQYGDLCRYDVNKEGKYFDPSDASVEPFEYEFPMLSWDGGIWGLLANFKTGQVMPY